MLPPLSGSIILGLGAAGGEGQSPAIRYGMPPLDVAGISPEAGASQVLPNEDDTPDMAKPKLDKAIHDM